MTESSTPPAGIAIVGMAGRFPGARDLDAFWRNVRDGVESIRRFTREEAAASGMAAVVLADPHLVTAAAVLDEVELFDAEFFGYSPRDAERMDPQQRLFLECAHQALEQAGYDPERYAGAIGVYAGAGANSYLHHLLSAEAGLHPAEGLSLLLGNDKDYLAARVSYKLNLRGPSLGVQTACSTSLVAVHVACQALLAYECDMAIAGGVSIRAPQRLGYLAQEESILSPDGHCRSFDAAARGTVFGHGLGAVVLKRLDDALRDGDTVHAVIRGSAVTHDGAAKVGFTAPGVDGQVRAIAEALDVAGVDPATLGYVEAHGTGTALGDPIEITALTQAFQSHVDGLPLAPRSCALGTVKSNLGHLDAAAGICGLIKTVLALEHRQIPPSLHFEKPNPRIDFAAGPFFVNTALREWPAGDTPRRAGVSSFGLGGTNTHVILEEAPAPPTPRPAAEPAALADHSLLPLSARTRTALDQATSDLLGHLAGHPGLDLGDAAHTLQVGRQRFAYRRVLLGSGRGEAPRAVAEGVALERPKVALLFTGQGAQRPGMARRLYEREPAFRTPFDLCCELLRGPLGLDLREVLFDAAGDTGRLNDTALAQPALFALEISLARLWESWGVKPEAMIGHSVGEYVAACLADVFSLADGLRLIAARGRLMQGLPRGAMLAVRRPPEAARELLAGDLALAVVNGPGLVVVSGPTAEVDALEQRLAIAGEVARRLHTSHAFHSPMMDPVIEPFVAEVRRCRLQPPNRPYLSNLTGTWIRAEEATDPAYWGRHLRETVRFGDGVRELLADPQRILLEVGPGETLVKLVQELPEAAGRAVLSTFGPERDDLPDEARVRRAAGGLWCAGVEVDWKVLHPGEHRRVPLPTYPFERRRYWVDSPTGAAAAAADVPPPTRKTLSEWFYAPLWKQLPPTRPAASSAGTSGADWLVLMDELGAGEEIADLLERRGDGVVRVLPGTGFAPLSRGRFAVDPADFHPLWSQLRAEGRLPQRIVHLWGLLPAEAPFARAEELGFHALLALARAQADLGAPGCELVVVSDQLFDVTGREDLRPERSLVLGPATVIPEEYPDVRCRVIDLDPAARPRGEQLVAELLEAAPPLVAWRGAHRWQRIFDPLALEGGAPGAGLREGGTYLITGGLGVLGMTIAESLFERARARLVLLGRTALPPREAWPAWLAENGEEDAVTLRIRRIQALEARGAEVLALAADVARVDQLAAAVGRARERFGAIHGVIHAAGLPASGLIQRKTREMTDAVFTPKIRGALALAEVFDTADLDFLVCFSSLGAITGAPGQVDYCAANVFLDVFAHARTKSGRRTLTIDWDVWQTDTWQEVGLKGLPELQKLARRMRDMYGVRPEEGVEAFHRLLASPHGLPQVAVSTKSLETTIRKHRNMLSEIERASSPATQPRPLPAETYVAPRNEVEETIAHLWQGALGIAEIGVSDNFFALGGHSLLAIRLVSELRKAFQVELPMSLLLEEAPTIAGLAEAIVDRQIRAAGDTELATAFAELNDLSDEEVRQLLAAELESPVPPGSDHGEEAR